MNLRREDVKDRGRMSKREEVVEAPYPAPKLYSDPNQAGSPTVKGCGERRKYRVCDCV
jgi:hypothetical protein